MEIVSINVGKPILYDYEGKQVETGIFKQPVEGPVFLTSLHFDGDGQADLRYHGGVDKAVCVYSHEHYPYWEKELSRQLPDAAFGENLTVRGMTEEIVCIGDTFQLGAAIVQVTQPRQPCHKLAKKYHMPDLPLRVQNTGFTGFYLRVLKEGFVAKTDAPVLLKRNPAAVSIGFANQVMHHDKGNREALERLLSLEELSASWRKTFQNRLEGIEPDVNKRLAGE